MDQRVSSKWRRLGLRSSVAVRLSAWVVAAVALAFLLYAWAMSQVSAHELQRQAAEDLRRSNQDVLRTLNTFEQTMLGQVARFGRLYRSYYGNDLQLDGQRRAELAGRALPVLLHAGKPLAGNFAIPDEFTERAGALATVFVRDGDDFVRISTSLKKADGSRAGGTVLDHQHPAWQRLLHGQGYAGPATLFGHSFMTGYEPVKNADGAVIGALFVGVDISAETRSLLKQIAALKLGDQGYYSVIDARPGESYGQLLVDPALASGPLQAKALRDADDQPYLLDMLKQGQGQRDYRLRQADGWVQQRMADFATASSWGWMVVASVSVDELLAPVRQARALFLGVAALVVLALAALLYGLIRQQVGRPLAQAEQGARQLAQGDLRVRLQLARHDEIGRLGQAIDGIGDGLGRIVGSVRQASGSIASSTAQIAGGNDDLAQRTERQADELRHTAALLQGLAEQVAGNARAVLQAGELADRASSQVSHDAGLMREAMQRMSRIGEYSQRIEAAVALIDGIAFQTNILALNASIEAAHAGEHGRGFAIVAGQVRDLALQAKQAAQSIGALIGESAEQVRGGEAVVAQAGESLQAVSDRVGEVAALVGEIGQASRQQAQDIAQINQAMLRLDDTTQQNSALVEEAAAAAGSLKQQAEGLTQSVGVFQLA